LVLRSFFSSKFIGFLAKLALTLAALWFAFLGLDMGQLTQLMHGQERGPVLAVMALILVQLLMGSERWRVVIDTIQKNGVHQDASAPARLSVKQAFNIYYISIFMGCCLPGGLMSSDVVRVWLAKLYRLPVNLTIHSVILDRILALLGLGVLVLVGLPTLGSLMGFDAEFPLLLSFAACVLGIATIFYTERKLQPLAQHKLMRWVVQFVSGAKAMLVKPAAFVRLLAYAVAAHVAYCCAAYILAGSLGLELSFLHTLFLIPPVILMMTLPLSVGGWGVREASMVGMLALVGVPKAEALLLSIQLGILNIVVCLPGSILWLTARKQSRQAHGD